MARPKTSVVDHEARVGDLQDLRAFALASDLRSLGAVAKVTGESKATVSRRITRLEAALGVSLLVRSSRGVAPTENGAACRQRIGEVLELLGDANAAVVHGGQATPSGQVRVSTPPGFSNVLAPLFASNGTSPRSRATRAMRTISIVSMQRSKRRKARSTS